MPKGSQKKNKSKKRRAETGSGLNYIADMTPAQIAGWLRLGLSTGNFAPILLDSRYAFSTQLTVHFQHKGTAPAAREQFRQGVVQAVAEWTPADGVSLLSELTYLATDIRALSVLPYLRALYYSGLRELDAEERYSVMTDIITALRLLAPGDGSALYDFFYEVYFDPHLDYRFVGQLFLALCACRPHQYYDYLPRFVETVEARADFFDAPDLYFMEFIDQVGIANLLKFQHMLDMPYRRWLLDTLLQSGYRLSVMQEFAELDPDSRADVVLMAQDTDELVSAPVSLRAFERTQTQREALTAVLREVSNQRAETYIQTAMGW